MIRFPGMQIMPFCSAICMLLFSATAIAQTATRNAGEVMALIGRVDENAQIEGVVVGKNPVYRVTGSTLLEGEVQFYGCDERGADCKVLVYVERLSDVPDHVTRAYMETWNTVFRHAFGILLEDGTAELRIPFDTISSQGYTQDSLEEELYIILEARGNFPYIPNWFVDAHQIDVEALMSEP